MDPLNLFDVEVPAKPLEARPEGFRRERLQLGPLLGAARIGATLYELPPGERISPYHYEYNNEEWLLVLEGRPTLRTPDGERELRPGDLVAFPEGPTGAHGAVNGSGEIARVLMLSTTRRPAVAVYPDSDKLAIWRLPSDGDEIIVERSAGVEYWKGELP
jgi:uncharacterized cupin superfamily protein